MRVAIIAFIAGVSSAASVPAGAAQLGLYAGVSYASVEKDATRSVFEAEAQVVYEVFGFAPVTTTSSSFDAKDSSYGFMVGYRLLEHLALEGGYMDLGDVTYRDRSDGVFGGTSPESWLQNVESGTSGIALSALGILPLSYRWEVYARGGLLLSNNTETIFISDGVGSERFEFSKSGVDFLAGVGASVSLLDVYSFRLEIQRVFAAGDDATLDEADVDMLSLGVTVSF